MWTRKELKMRGKAAFKANFWRCVLVAFILTLIGGAIGSAGGRAAADNAPVIAPEETTVSNEYLDGAIKVEMTGKAADIEALKAEFDALLDEIREEGGQEAVRFVIVMIAGIFGAILAVSFVLQILLINPLKVGCNRFFAENSSAPAQIGEIGYGFRSGYGRVVDTMLRTDIYTLLWSLLFVIPGIIKSYSYRMVPYILAEEPEMSGKEAIDRSRHMMNGNKWRAFVLDLSWILWILFGVVTLGFGLIFYVSPYMLATDAELYHALKNN